MGISIKHVVIVSVVLSVIAFGYEIGFAEIDVVRSPRAQALDAMPSSWRLISNVRSGLVNGQAPSARSAGDELIKLYPQDPQSWLNRGYAYRFGIAARDQESGDQLVNSEEIESWEGLMAIVEQWDIDSLSGTGLSNVLYLRGWALRGMGRIDESRADFAVVARITEEVAGIEDHDGAVDPQTPNSTAYNLACYWTLAGNLDRALDYWSLCVNNSLYALGEGTNGLVPAGGVNGEWWRVDPDFEDLWDDDRFWSIGQGED